MMHFKDYIATVEFDAEAEIFHGEVVNTRDVITFQGKSVAELKRTLRDSVEDYLDFCKKRGEEPAKPFSGKFVIRLSPDTHRKAFIAAKKAGESLNTWVAEKIEEAAKRA